MQYMIFTFVVLCGGGCVGKSIIQRERESESVALIARASTDIQRAQVACRESTINYLYSVEMNVVYFHLLQQQGEYKQPRTKIVTLYSHSYVLSTCARLLALQLYVYDFFRCTTTTVLSMLVDGRTLRLVRKEAKRREGTEEINFYFLLSLLHMQRNAITPCIYSPVDPLYVHQIFTSDCTLHQRKIHHEAERYLMLLVECSKFFTLYLFSLNGFTAWIIDDQARLDFNKVTKNKWMWKSSPHKIFRSASCTLCKFNVATRCCIRWETKCESDERRENLSRSHFPRDLVNFSFHLRR